MSNFEGSNRKIIGGTSMSSAVLWERIIERARASEFEIPTAPRVRKTPLWFRVSSKGNALFISQAKDNAPSSSLKMPRRITYDEFERIYHYYDLRLKGAAVSQEVLAKSVNTVYIYGLIADARSGH
ncbi:hypothetical protein SD71_00285 [Cohnella kolymensis]|uniref:Uncharacterized protein n=1 Tax=Cohnella kolymensis TaxID=1590652 RepID=A0ABR5A827_9BACL|nr:hypothetical protein [Cohnella kolymensis]KIL37214.1 hypothetical protein SD71_00285 [Cohnella kolymensis]